MEQKTSSTRGGIGFVGLLTIVFIVLKLVGVINWSWFWVLSPIIFSAVFIVVVAVVTVILWKKLR